jgi:hypothetical protein
LGRSHHHGHAPDETAPDPINPYGSIQAREVVSHAECLILTVLDKRRTALAGEDARPCTRYLGRIEPYDFMLAARNEGRKENKMIDTISKSQLRELLQVSSGPCISIFMPTHRRGAQTLQNPIRLKNLLRHVTQDLTATGLHAPEISKFLEPVSSLLGDEQFWQHQGDGLALFLSPELFRSFRLPAEFQELAIVADRFQLKSILSLFAGDGRFYVLSLSLNHVHLFLATRDKISEQPLKGVPQSLSEALSSGPPAMQLQYHTASGEGADHRHLTAFY